MARRGWFIDGNVLTVARGGRFYGGSGGDTAIAAIAFFGDTTVAGTGGWRPQLASGAVESLTSYDSLESGSLGVYTPSISSGKLVFSGAAGAPDGAVLRCTGASGRVYDVTISEVANRRDIASDSEATTYKTIGANDGLTVSIRQNAQVAARSRLVAGTDFLSGGSQGDLDIGLTSPTTVSGEGAYVAGEYHIHSWRGFHPSRITIDSLIFADQTTASSLIIETTTSRRNQNITVKNCRFQIDYDVDVTGNWSTGFGSTGFAPARFIYVTGSYTQNVTIQDNVMIGGYLHTEINFNGYLIYTGNYQRDAYFDMRKTNSVTNMGGVERVRLEGGNFYGNAKVYSVNESTGTEPHMDGDQVSSGGVGILVTYYEANVHWKMGGARLQNRFHSDRANTATGGHRWSIAGEFMVTNTTHCLTNDTPDNLLIERVLVLPEYGSTLPLASGINRLGLGTAKAGDGQNFGSHVVKNSAFGDQWGNLGNIGTPTVTETNVVDQSGWVDANYADAVTNWADWSTMPEAPTFAAAWEYAQTEAGQALENQTPYALVTPGVSSQSDYSISSSLRPVPTLSALTVTTASTAAFTVATDIVQNSTIFWAVFSTDVTDAASIRSGFNGNTQATAWGINHRGNSAGSITGGGTASLGAGTYYLCVAQYNGLKKSHVVTTSFTV